MRPNISFTAKTLSPDLPPPSPLLPTMPLLDQFFQAFFVVDLFLAMVIDATGIGLASWPPAFVKELLGHYCALVDPLFCEAPIWFRTMLAIEAVLYPPFIVAAILALRPGRLALTSDVFEIAAAVWATVNVYSVVVIAAEALAGDAMLRSPWPAAYVGCYAPFIIVPAAFCVHLYRARRGWLKVK